MPALSGQAGDAPGTYDLATRLLPVSGLSASGRSENLCVYLEGERHSNSIRAVCY